MDAGRAEAVEKDLDRLIERRHDARARDPDEEHDLWRASERAHGEARRKANRAAWYEHHELMRELHEDLAAEHAAKALKLLEEPTNGRSKA